MFAATLIQNCDSNKPSVADDLSETRATNAASPPDGAAASQRKFNGLLFWALDRLSREGVLETLQHLNRLTSYGVNYRSFTEQ